MTNQISAKKIIISLLCGGSSLERGISLNSARSVLDHIESSEIDIAPIYFDAKKRAYKISKAQLYSNTPSDFDFKLQKTAEPLTDLALVRFLAKTDLAFPVMHGPFGEDGGIQRILERHGIPFVGSSSAACRRCFDKFIANEFIGSRGFFILPSALLKIYKRDHKSIIENFFKVHRITRAVVKPASGGSSIGVFSVSTPAEALEKAKILFSKRLDTRLVAEPFATGCEFTVIILQNRFNLPVALPPTEIETDYTAHQFFDFRKKYLPTRQVAWHCPPRFNDAVIEKIQAQAEQLFSLLGMRDFARFDGWVLPDGNIWFCDFNPVSGMEQNSFLFQQAARVGMTHSDILSHIVQSACKRYGIFFPEQSPDDPKPRKPVNIILGGPTSERQVSLMSGTNVWLKLRKSEQYEARPFLLDVDGKTVWRLPYHLTLNHTVEEIAENCINYHNAKERLEKFERVARIRLGFKEKKDENDFFEPYAISLDDFIKSSDFVFLALHGGDGENGVVQRKLDEHGVSYNGAGERVSRLCMDKWQTSRAIDGLAIEGVGSIPGKVSKTEYLFKLGAEELSGFWLNTRKSLSARTLIVKPRSDGCSSGVVHIFSADDLQKYLKFLEDRASFIPRQSFRNQRDQIEMPIRLPDDLIFEQYMETDVLRVRENSLKHISRSGWIEITIGVVEQNGKLHAFSPSITVAGGEVLTVEEKFQGGTGVNITPPPTSIMSSRTLRKIQERIEALAARAGIRGYSRIDAFAQIRSGNLQIIEINTLPGLTPSTVFFHQALAEIPPIFPRELLELLIKNKGY